MADNNEEQPPLGDTVDAILPKLEAHWTQFPDSRILARKAQALAVCEMQAHMQLMAQKNGADVLLFKQTAFLDMINQAVFRAVQLMTAVYATPADVDKMYNRYTDTLRSLVDFNWDYIEGQGSDGL